MDAHEGASPHDADDQAYAHRRLSWSNDQGEQEEPGSSNAAVAEEVPLFSSVEKERVDASLFPSLRSPYPDIDTSADDDDEARLTGKTRPQEHGPWTGDLSVDSERSAGFTSDPGRWSAVPSPLTDVFSNAFHRASMRVAAVHFHSLYGPLQGPQDSLAGLTLDDVDETTQIDDDEGAPRQVPPPTHLRGRALGILGPMNPLRVRLYKLLIHPYAEPTILALIIVIAVTLVVQASRTLLLPDDKVPIRVKGYFHAWEDFVIFVIFVLFTVEALGRICIFGLLLDPEVPMSSFSFSFPKPVRMMSPSDAASDSNDNAPLKRSTSLTRGHTLRRVYDNVAKPFSISRSTHAPKPSLAESLHDQIQSEDPEPPTFLSRVLKSDVLESNSDILVSLPFRLEIEMARSKLGRNIPYLRQGWGRIDFLALIGFWVSFALATTGLERGTHHIGIFRALSVLRTARLLGVTNGTAIQTIMRSLKIARPMLANVVYFIIFAMVLFSVIGVQSFQRSLRRSCNLSPTLGEDSVLLDQLCGGHINATTLTPSPYLHADGTSSGIIKGFICPLGQICQAGDNPFGGVENFDTVYYAALQIVVLASGSTWGRVMYQTIASEHPVAAIFFVFGVLTLNFWLFNLLVAVITHSFSAIRSGTKKSAFGAAPLGRVSEEPEEGWSSVTGRPIAQSRFKTWWSYTRWFWVLLALISLVVQATTTVDMSKTHREAIDTTETIITIAFDIEILVRIAVELPEWRNFFLHGNNLLDLAVAIGCSIIQIPPIHKSSVYPWLTVFQLARFYRVLLVVPRMKPLMLTGFGNMYGLANMTLFLVLMNFLAALIAIQLIQGDMSEEGTLNFSQLFNSFLAVYQICSGENWTELMYEATKAELPLGQAIIVCAFVCCWLLFSNFIVIQMFIAVINENFEVAEEAKREMQASKYKAELSQPASTKWSHINPYRWFVKRSTRSNVESMSPTPISRELEAETIVQRSPPPMDHKFGQRRPTNTSSRSRHGHKSSFGLLHEIFTGNETKENIPLLDLHRVRADSKGLEDEVEDVTDQYPGLPKGSPFTDPGYARRTHTIDMIQRYPTYDKTFWVIPQTNPIRRLCQQIVHPSGGERVFGTPPSEGAHSLFLLFIFMIVLGGVVVEAIATPLYRRNYYTQQGQVWATWFNITEATFVLVFIIEFFIKIIADGFLFGPNAYVRSVWNILDFVIMVGMAVNVSFTLFFVHGLNRFVRALKALQALRFMTLVHRMRRAFEDLILSGFIRILDAAVLAMLYLIPFSVWGTNIFAGLMNGCNDLAAKGIGDCTNEYINTIHEGKFGFLIPRVWEKPAPTTAFSFDDFPSSLLILFEIVSQTGWVDVMFVAMSITGEGLQPRINAAQANAIFFLIYNVLGAVVILTLFLSIIIGNFAARTGSAYLTEPQREWKDLQKLLKRLSPSKRPKFRPTSPIRAWCFDRAVHKHGWWTRMMTLLFLVQIIALMSEAFSAEDVDDWHNIVSLIISLIYVVDTSVRLYGLGLRSFCANGWNLFDVVVSFGSLITTIIARFFTDSFAVQLLQKLFLVSIASKLIQRLAPLNQLFKTGLASLPEILNLIALWWTLIFFFAIMYMEVFGLTKWYSAETVYQNYQNMGSAVLMLVSFSTGEGWNQFMHDYANEYPRCTQSYGGTYETDCGSTGWAFSLFIAWNLLSMYIFLNVFTGVIVESFSYVFQSTGGVLKSITRHETRAFKKAWTEFSDPNTRLLERPNLVPFLAKLGGVFEVRIYPSENSVSSILAACQDKLNIDNETGGVSLRKLNRQLDQIDPVLIRRRRVMYTRIYHEANVWYSRGCGISFTEMLMLLAHHTLIDDREALGLKELEERKVILEWVADYMALDKVRSQLAMFALRRRFLRERERAGAAAEVGNAAPVIPPISTDTTWGLSASGEVASPFSVQEEWRSADELMDPRMEGEGNLLDDSEPAAVYSSATQHAEVIPEETNIL